MKRFDDCPDEFLVRPGQRVMQKRVLVARRLDVLLKLGLTTPGFFVDFGHFGSKLNNLWQLVLLALSPSRALCVRKEPRCELRQQISKQILDIRTGMSEPRQEEDPPRAF